MKNVVCCAFLLIFMYAAVAADISTESLLNEMLSRKMISEYPSPDFVCRQASSYDRASHDKSRWFANSDTKQFIRTEHNNGRLEWVMLETDKPGAIVRWWITGKKNPGNFYVYIDGAKEPAVAAAAEGMVGGDYLVKSPLSEVTSRGMNLYLPIAYSKSCKITYSSPTITDVNNFSENLYYNINYREYSPSVKVKSFTMNDLAANSALIDKVQKNLLEPLSNCLPQSRTVAGQSLFLEPQKSIEKTVSGGGAISRLSIKIDSQNIRQAMRSVVLAVSFDGNDNVWCPVGEFFATGLGVNPYMTWWTQMSYDGTMSCCWPMPFKDTAKLVITNYGSEPVVVSLSDIAVADYKWTDNTMYFNCSWRGDKRIQVYGGKDETMKADWNYITIKGRGVYVGDTLAIYNRTNRWWGEGDEKVYLDGEAFPSHFGTGTEDYYGYAWCSPMYFTSPFHAQPSGEGNNSVNHSINTRIRILDGIPFNRSLKFDMELWHWKTSKFDYASTTYWYAFAGSRANGMKDAKKAAWPVGDTDMAVIEGESGEVKSQATGGRLQVQQGNWGLSGGSQLWWRGAEVGDKLTIVFNVKDGGVHEAYLRLITAEDYGRFAVSFFGEGIKFNDTIDLYSPELIIIEYGLGKIEFRKGEYKLEFVVLENNPSAKDGNMLGLDCLQFLTAD